MHPVRKATKDRPEIVSRHLLPEGWTPSHLTGWEPPILTPTADPIRIDSHDVRHLSPTVVCDRHTFVGVSAAVADVLIQRGDARPGTTERPHDGERWVVLLCRKAGRYDGSLRDQWVFRRFVSHQCLQWPEGHVIVTTTDPTQIAVEVETDAGATVESQVYPRIDAGLVMVPQVEIGRVLLWHWTRYYRFLPRADAERLADVMVKLNRPRDLAEANRIASRLLYQEARGQGWRKLTAHEQGRHGLTGQWHRVEEIDAAVASDAQRDGHPTGTGEYTRDVAAGQAMTGVS